jgi:gliding motility-associated lipoprotein GldH
MKKIALFFALTLLVSCDGKSVYSQIDKDFKENRWQKSDIKVYEFEVSQAATPYGIDVFMSYVYGAQFAKIPLIAEVTYPNGEMTSVTFDFVTKTASGEELGDCSGDFCDLSQKIELPKPLSPGKYRVRLMHNFPNEYLPNVLALGLKVEQPND